jgi:iron complex transport system substrate-binding protein
VAERRRSGIASVAVWIAAAALVVAALVSLRLPSRAGEAAAPAVEPTPPPGGAQRIVSLAPSVTETVYALGKADRLVGVSTYCDYPPEATRLPRVGSYLTPNIEAIVALRPDVVIGVPTPGNQPGVDQLRTLGVPVVIVGETTLADAWTAMATIGAWVGDAPGGAALVSRVRGEVETTRAAAASEPRRRVLLVVGHDPLVTVGSGLYLDELIEIAGGENIARSAGGRWPRLSLETAVALAPDVIIDGAMGSEAPTALAGYWQPYRSIPAVRDGRVRAQSSSALLRPGPRLGIAARELHELIHGSGAPT